MSGGVRRQLGPVRKRLEDRLSEAKTLTEEDDVARVRDVRSKLSANITYHDNLTKELGEIVGVSEDEKALIEETMENCMNLNLDANEMLCSLDERIGGMAKIESNFDKIDLEIKAKQRDKLDREIEKLKVETECARKVLDQPKQENPPLDVVPGTSASRKVKLPLLPLPRFSGIITDWPTFWDSFKSTIHADSTLSKIDKFKYLMSSLEGEARDTLTGFNLSDAQYEQAITHLCERYDHKEYIIHNYYAELSNLPKCENVTSELRKTFNFIEVQLRSLESMGENINNNYIVALVKGKLPDPFNLKLEENRDGDWTLQKLRKSITKLILARERSETSNTIKGDHRGMEYTAEGLLSKDAKISCCFCEKNHWADECQTYKSLEARKTKIRGRCFICLSPNHLFRQCRSERPCFYCKRKRNHHSSLCPEKFGNVAPENRDWNKEEGMAAREEISGEIDPEVIMKTVKVIIKNMETGKRESANVLLDTGSKRSYISRKKAESLGLSHGSGKVVKFNTFGNSSSTDVMTEKNNFSIIQRNGCNKIINAKIVPIITAPIIKQKVNLKKYQNTCRNLQMADIPTQNSNIDLDILIGNDYYDDIIKPERIVVDEGLYLINSSIGWMLSGRVKANADDEVEHSMLIDENESKIQSGFWDLETIGIKYVTVEEENDEIFRKFNTDIKQNGKRYQISWPWKLSKTELPSNYALAEARLKSLVNNLKNDEDMMKRYDDIIQKLISDGIVEVANNSKEYLQRDTVITHYLPHHMVQSDSGNKKKVRVVYEGCAKTHKSKRSLNECLHPGTNMVANLCGILLRFRMHCVAFVADIEKAYLQLELNPNDRDVTRFLWLKNVNKPVSKRNISELRFCRVIWGIISAAFLLASTIAYHLLKYNTLVTNDISLNLYVDNLISGVDSASKAKSYYDETKLVFNEAAMNMCKWVSNDSDVMRHYEEVDRVIEMEVKVLGLMWRVNTDELCFYNLNTKHSEIISKRTILKEISSVYDPLGLISPILLKPKLLLQDLWKQKIEWDDEIPEEHLQTWIDFRNDLSHVDDIRVKRFLDTESENNKQTFEMITFADASKNAYAAVVYLKVTNGTSTNINLVFSKARLSPIKENLTIPRLELMGVLIGCRASKFVANQLNVHIDRQVLFTDSKCVIEWCRTEKPLNRFVLDRVKEIRESGIPIAYVKSEENPADIASRGETVEKLKGNELWWYGPEWAKNCLDEMISQNYELTVDAQNSVVNEMKGPKTLLEVSLAAVNSVEKSSPFDLDETKFSSHWKLIRITAWCARFINNCRNEKLIEGYLSSKEIREACDMWTRFIQQKHFTKNESNKTKVDSIVRNLGVYTDENRILRCHGRFQFLSNFPRLLPKKSHYTNLIIIRYHRNILHQGVSQTLANIRSDYWIIQGRSAVRRSIRQCLICIHWEGAPFKTPRLAPLPEYVLTAGNPPFTYVGIDYLGPLFIKDEGDDRRKHWVCLFTCLTIRAVHLELIQSMSTENFLLCLRRFIARRGAPQLIISDNASQIKSGDLVLQKIWMETTKNVDVQSFVSNKGITWKYIIEYAPWKGGFYERLVGMTKRALRKSLGRCSISNVELCTLLTEVEAILNSRPLVYVTDDVDPQEAITPAHFLSINHKIGTPDIEDGFDLKEGTAKTLIENWKKGQMRLKNFWHIWLSEYLPALRERHILEMKRIKGEITRMPRAGEVVIVKEENMPRGSWKLARVQGLIKSDVDDIERAANLISPSGRTFRRPFRLIYPLENRNEHDVLDEIDDQAKANNVPDEVNDHAAENNVPATNRIPRKAAIVASKKIKTMQ